MANGGPIAISGDLCGVGLVVASQNTVKVNGISVVRVGDAITPHGDNLHASAVMVEGSANFKVGGISVCRIGDLASCGHSLAPGQGVPLSARNKSLNLAPSTLSSGYGAGGGYGSNSYGS